MRRIPRMPRPPVLPALLLLVACGQAAGSGDPVLPRAGSGELLTATRSPEPHSGRADEGLAPSRVAVVIGIDRYLHSPDLTAAVADARLLADALEHLGFDEVRLLLDRRATRAAILRSMRHLAGAGGRGEPGVLFFAGHIRHVDGDPDGDGEDQDEALLLSDGSLVYDGEVARALRRARGPLWLAYAGCYAAGFSDAAGPGRISTYAAAEHRLAYESPDLGQSFMVEFLVARALMDRGILEVEEMYRYASNSMVGRYRRFRPVQDDRVPGSLMLAEPAPPPEEEQATEPCLLGC